MGFVIFTLLFWVLMLCGLVGTHQRLRETCSLILLVFRLHNSEEHCHLHSHENLISQIWIVFDPTMLGLEPRSSFALRMLTIKEK